MFATLALIDPSIAAQMGPEAVPDPRSVGPSAVVWSAIGAFLSTLLVGAILIGVSPDYTRERMADALARPGRSFLYGLGSLLVLLLVIFALVITVVGILIAIPLAILAYLAWVVGAAIAFLAIGDRLIGHDDGWAKPLVVGAAINGGLTLSGVGGLVTFAIGAVGFGAVLRGAFG